MLNQRKEILVIIIIHKRIFERVRDENDRDSHSKSFKNKNIKSSSLNSRILKFIKFNRDNNVKLSHIYKNNENKRKSEYKIEYKNLTYFHYDKKDHIKSYYSNKNKLFIYVNVVTTKNDSISQPPQKRDQKNEK